MGTNSVQRLFEILRKIPRTAVSANDIAVEGWKRVFDIPDEPEHSGSVFLMYNEFIQLIIRAKEDILSLDINHDLYLRYYHNIEKLMNFQSLYQQKWHFVTSTISGFTTANLEFCADAMSQLPNEKVIPEDDLIELKKEVEKLLDAVLEKDIEIALKKVIVLLLEKVNLAIIEYKINGIESFQKILELSVGTLIFNRELFDTYGNEEEQLTFRDIFQKIDGFIRMAKSIKELLQPVIEILPAFLPK